MSPTIALNIVKLRQRIAAAEKTYQRQPNSVQLMAVSKTRSAAMVRAVAAAGLTDMGENYLQEALDKQRELTDLKLNWHFIGPIQSNKTRSIAEHFDWVHSVDRVKIAQRLSDQRPEGMAPLNICLQVNISGEETKSGLALEALGNIADQLTDLPNLSLRGLMAIPQATESFDQQRHAFAQLAGALQQLQHKHPSMTTLSMGMSNDIDAAIAEGATIVRIGTGIFGPRQ